MVNDLRFDAFPRFMKSVFFEKYIRAKSLERRDVTIADFTMLRMLGHGAFGAVNACVKNDTGKMWGRHLPCRANGACIVYRAR